MVMIKRSQTHCMTCSCKNKLTRAHTHIIPLKYPKCVWGYGPHALHVGRFFPVFPPVGLSACIGCDRHTSKVKEELYSLQML